MFPVMLPYLPFASTFCDSTGLYVWRQLFSLYSKALQVTIWILQSRPMTGLLSVRIELVTTLVATPI